MRSLLYSRWRRDRPGEFRALRSPQPVSQTLEGRAIELANAMVVAPGRRAGRSRLSSRVRQNGELLARAYRALGADVRQGEFIESGSEWLLDNFHVVTGELRHIERDLPVGFYRRLPVLAGRRHRGRARIETLAVELIRYGDSRIDRGQLVQFLRSFQTVAPLTIGELWAWPSALKLALIESLRRLAEDLLDARDGRRDADRYLERLGKRTASLSSFRDIPRSSSFVAQVLHRSREYGEQGGSVRGVIEEYLQSEGMNAEEAIRVEHRRQAVTQVSLANAVMSLRLSAELDWSEVVEAVSVVDEALRRDPAGAYTRMDFLSRDRQRRAIESLAPLSGPEQVDVALTAVELAREATGSQPIGARETHVGYYLVDRGRKTLERAIGHRVSVGTRWRRFWQRHSTLAYLGSVSLLTALFTLAGVFFALRNASLNLWVAALVVLLAIPASEVAIFLVNRWVAALVTPRRLLRLEFKGGIPPTARTLVVVPTLFAKVSDVETMIEHVEVLALGNLDPCIHFAILSDLPDAHEAHLPGDEVIIQSARAGIERLSRTLGDDKFFLFHRERRWNEAEARWMGWERKRGKLEELNRLLRGATDTSYVVQLGRVERLRDVRYCLTLDSDTRLPRDAAKALIGVIEHPLNRPRVDPTLGRVTEGYGILQPRVSVTMSSAAGSRFARLYAGHTGVDPYTTAVSDVYQDVFDEGIFTGKGLYDVDAFTASLEGRVPENSLLSHDLFEGVHARTALVSDVEVVDDYPSNVLAHAKRQHRWVRGDWQILQWLWPIVPTRDGYARNRLSFISRWKILDNLRRSLVPPATLLMFLFGWTVLPGPAWAWTIGGLVPLAIPAYAWLIDITRGRSPGEPWRVFWRTMLDDLGTALARMGLQLTFLAQQAWEMAHAVVLTLIRMTWTHRQLLEWETAASMAGKLREGTSRLYWMRMVASPAIAGLGVSLVLAFGPEAWSVALPVLTLWGVAPLVALILSRPIVIRRDMLTGRDRQFVLDVARRTWRYFEVFAVEADRHLPPDNVQMQPETRVAQRTSPTNIGLGLVAVVAARELGLIDDETCLRRIDASLTSVESLERHSGHLLNWYETVHGTPLRPAYISTVDSGNFVGCLMTVQGALRSRYPDAARQPPEVVALLARLSALIDGTDFRMLYHESRGLFTIGYRLPDHDGPGGPDPSFYDLLASEARLASFIAIAKGDVPQSHWFRLGRSLTSVRGTPVLLSWSASMFEYLMPLLFQRLYPETLLAQSSRAVVERQQRYGADRSVPWGISESAYAVTDRHGTFQYKAFGLPGLGLKRGLADELVVAPYATALAAMIAPSAAVANLRHLAKEKLLDEFGFYDAIDYTARAPGDGEATEETPSGAGRVVPSYFAHHQGMTLAALANVLVDDVVVSWFHDDPRVQATELLLQERVPRQAAAGDPRPPEDISALPSPPPPPVRRVRSPHTAYPHAQFLSNGDCVSVVTHAGGGHLSFKGLHVTRARPDATLDPGSQYIYLRDVRESLLWSATYQPTAVEPDDFGVTLASDGARFYRRDGELTTRLDVAVSSEDDVEVRMLLITNTGGRAREIDVTTYVELALSAPAPDLAHPAFGKLFVQTEALPDIHALVAHRRPRGHTDTPVWAFHVLSQSRASGGPIEWDTDRARFIGRGRTLRAPAALDGRALSATEGLVLDPIFSLRQRVRLRPGASVRLCVSTGIAPDRATAHGLAHKYHQFGNARQAFMQAATDEHARLRHLDVSADDAILFDRLASRVLYEDRSLRADAGVLAANSLGQPGLWRFAISGDLPILLVRVSESDDASLVRECLQAQEYWRLKGLVADLVVINEHPPGYVDEVHAGLVALLDRGPWRTLRHQPGGVYLLRADEMSDVERTLVAAVARAVLEGSRGDLRAQLDRPYARRLAPPPIEPAPLEALAPSPVARPPVPVLRFGTELGGFTEDGREFVVVREGGRQTPLPWVNVIANPAFGTIVTEAGSAHTWSINSRENRLTPFANDPVLDPTGEAWYIRDNDTGEVWCPTPGPVPVDPSAVVVIRHGAGLSTFSRVHAGIATELEVAVDRVEPVKVSRLALANRGDRPVNLTLCAYCEWVLGPPVARVTDAVVTAHDAESRAVFATRAAAGDFAGRVAFAAVSLPVAGVTCDRRAFLGRHGSTANPAALRSGVLDGRMGAGFDPCAALQSDITLQPGQSLDVVWLIGQAADAADARRVIAERGTPDAARHAIDDVRSFWDDLCGQVSVTTPDDSFDVMLNRWLLYQTVSCRIWSRSGYHQPGGAFGYRDQLQDVLSLLMVRPAMTREHILRAAAHQFVEGDVQHWWHEPSGRGLRTRCSDDMLWLPFAVLEYVMVTGDTALFDVPVPFIEAPALAPGEDDIFGQAAISSESGTIYEHCVRAIARGFTVGSHGLPLIGSGDWNDGMNRVGEAGRGESTWLGFFLFAVLTRFAPVARARGDLARAERYEAEATRLSEKLELAWDGQWFRRGYYDDGTPLGSAQNDECKIDAISQSWAVLSGAVSPQHAERAMDAVRERLIQRGAGVILLLDPPFDRSAQDPGYIKAYPPGVRENGGQYTHAATWTLMALAELGYGDEAVELFHMANPVNRTRRATDIQRYKLEPYVMAGDVYSRAPHAGRGGWSWYTGSSGWMYRVGLESILGIRRRGDRLEIDPCIPASWPEFVVRWRHGTTEYEITVLNPDRRNRGVSDVSVDGQPSSVEAAVMLTDDGGVHRVVVTLGEPSRPRVPGMPRTAERSPAGAGPALTFRFRR